MNFVQISLSERLRISMLGAAHFLRVGRRTVETLDIFERHAHLRAGDVNRTVNYFSVCELTPDSEPAMSDRRTLANRNNSSKSTGPQTIDGKAVASRNALRHGLRSNRLLLDGEDPEEFAELQADLFDALAPVGAVELSLAERIVIAIWRQRRVARAEAAALSIERRDDAVLDGLRRLHNWDERDEITATCLKSFDPELVPWCRAVLEEVEALEDHTLEELENEAPHAWAQLKGEADEDNETPEAYLSGSENGLAEFVGDLCRWCRRQLAAAEKRPQLLEFVEQLRQRGTSFCRFRNSTS